MFRLEPAWCSRMFEDYVGPTPDDEIAFVGRYESLADDPVRALVSVVIPFLNPGRFLREAIDSVVAQTYDAWELILVDDGSTDESTAVARDCAARHPDRVVYAQHPGGINAGQAASRNLGIELARGEYVALLDADDVWLPEKLARQMAAFAAHPRAAMCMGPSQYWHSWAGRPGDAARDFVPQMAAELGVAPDSVVEPPLLALRAYPLGAGSAPCPSSLLFRRDVARTLGGFESAFRGIYGLYEDQTFLVKVYLAAPVYVAGDWLDRHRQHDASCEATVIRAGHYTHVREYFLRWLAARLAADPAQDPLVSRAVSAALSGVSGRPGPRPEADRP